MALDFPASPITGATYTGPNGVIWVWDGAKWVNGTQSAVAPALNGVGRNLVMNPLFAVAQRGVGPWTTSNSYTADRWKLDFANGTLSASLQGISDGSRAAIGDESAQIQLSLVVAGTAGATDYARFAQNIENVTRLSGKTITISFWMIAATGLKVSVNFYQFFGTGGSPSASVVGVAQLITAASAAWTRYSLVFAVPSIAGKTFGANNDNFTGILFHLSAGPSQALVSGANPGVQSGTFTFWGVQLEVGSVATPLDYGGSPQQQLAECQRFYQTGVVAFQGYAVASAGVGQSVLWPVTPRAVPTVTPAWSNTNITSPNVNAGGSFLQVYGSATATGGCVLTVTFTASADL